MWFIRPLLFFDTTHRLKEVWQGLLTERRFRLKVCVLWAPVLAACLMAGTLGNLFLYWIVPLLWAKPALEFWSEVSDHFHPDLSHGCTRNCPSVLCRLLFNACQDGYHEVHHRYPTIPWHNVSAAHAEMYGSTHARQSGLWAVFLELQVGR